MTTLEGYRIGNHAKIVNSEVIEYVVLNQIIKIIKIEVDSYVWKNNPTTLIIIYRCKRPGHLVY